LLPGAHYVLRTARRKSPGALRRSVFRSKWTGANTAPIPHREAANRHGVRQLHPIG
jgi:hypothetical protein